MTVPAPQMSRLESKPTRTSRLARVKKAITINRPLEEVYRFWRDLANLPRFMAQIESIEVRDERRSRWVAGGPAGKRVEWDVEIIEDRPNERIAWRSASDGEVGGAGSVRFRRAPGGRGTEVVAEVGYHPPGGPIAAAVAKLIGEEPGRQVDGDLHRLKQVLETGEVLLSDASIHRGPHPARPSGEIN